MSVTIGNELILPMKRRRIAFLLAMLCLLLAGVFCWGAYIQWRQNVVQQKLEQARDGAVTSLLQVLSGQAKQLQNVVQRPAIVQVLGGGDVTAAAAAVREQFPGTEEVQVLTGDLSAAYADVARSGYARLGLIEAALGGDGVKAWVVRDGTQIGLGMAVMVKLGQAPAVVYLRLPLRGLISALDAIEVPNSTYLALRQGSYTVVERGSAALASGGEALAKPLGWVDLRVAAAVPQLENIPFDLGLLPSLIAAGVFVLVAAVLLLVAGGHRMLPRRHAQMADAEQEQFTLRESVVQESPERAIVLNEENNVALSSSLHLQSNLEAVVQPSLFHEDDIHGVVPGELNPGVAKLIGQAIGSAMQVKGLSDIVIGRDDRVSSFELSAALSDGLRHAGCNVVDIGLVPIPVVYFAACHLGVGSCVAVTGGHHPHDYNGFKIVLGGESLSSEAMSDLYQCITNGRLYASVDSGSLSERDVVDDYIQRIADDVQLNRPLKIVADLGHGAAEEILSRLFKAIGADLVSLYGDIDGVSLHGHPDSDELGNLQKLIQRVEQADADLGLAFDGDAASLRVVTRQGEVILSDSVLMLFATDVLQRNPGALVIYDAECTSKLSDYVLRNGGSPLMWKTGHSSIKAKMRETGAELAGEMSGYFFFKERWYGFEDALYAAARLLEILAQREGNPSQVFAALPHAYFTAQMEQSVECDAQACVQSFIEEVQRSVEGSVFDGARLFAFDGLRADFTDGWGLVRVSDTASALVLRFEADTQAGLERIQSAFRTHLQALLPGQILVF
ncbi:phosphomannomutase/phosphoglucomutase [Xylella fastidiosa subsp. pauca]|uniref:phosphomannomutase/phosphoglucomutase n=1 Tax=Xylella fastidiosa TaxID=2371 RepID=UPI0005827289|nr:phosphomannomutase/phosphoglucomutase [Xylella fastidiosa]ARO67787.1 phosphomannomutase/phosphoglucomutase [Xylella fastidiosa subsp. pauca]AVI19981.1 phosphomannomutase [Xylella fastidiosa]KIA58971.1 phosphomannomutase [Xylella fastidiosa]KXB12288.1 phosphomannomutase [Xylella fastidiosa]KXB14147.1 phosphomannomutase [Xylella fastidiosa]